MEKELEHLRQQFTAGLLATTDVKEVEKIEILFLGRKGDLTLLVKKLPELVPKERVRVGQAVNALKAFFKKELEKKTLELKTHNTPRKSFDVSLPGKRAKRGHIHPLTHITDELIEIFSRLNFLVVEGPEVETEFYNFDALNIPKNHPARDMWDTFWLRGNQKIQSPKSKAQNPENERLLLRTHTSPMQIRFMETHEPPLRIVVPGRVFRYEASDATHESEFYQLEGLFVDKEVSVANFKAVIEFFFKKFFGKDFGGIRLRPSYFPFTEPSFEVDVYWKKKEKWLEVMGAGMVHQNVFQAAGFAPNEWQGFAFGLGIDRVAMLKYGISDIRMFYSGDLRVIRQF